MRRLVALVLAALSLGAAPRPAPVALEALLAETPAPTLDAYRLFTDPGGRAPNAGVTPYALNTPLFSDHAAKSRFIFLPPGTKAGYRATGPLDLPVGAALVKTFAYPSDLRQPGIGVRKIETRLLIHQTRGWVALTYLWNAEQNQAVLKRAGTRLPVQVIDMAGLPLTIDYAVPNVNQCKECHGVSGELSPIGPKARNLNGDFTYPTGRGWACWPGRRLRPRRRAPRCGMMRTSPWTIGPGPISTPIAAIVTTLRAWRAIQACSFTWRRPIPRPEDWASTPLRRGAAPAIWRSTWSPAGPRPRSCSIG
jgi:hypothetical protein